MLKLNNNYWLFISVFLIFLTLYPSLNLAIPRAAYEDFVLVFEHFGKFSGDLKFSNAPFNYYLSLYGFLETSVMVAYKLLGSDSRGYYILSLILRIMAASTIYYFVSKWSKSKVAGFISSLFFGVSYPGIQNTIWVTLFISYFDVILIIIFLDRWLTFHLQPTTRNFLSSLSFLFISVFIYPARMVGILLIVLLGEIYWITKVVRKQTKYRIKIVHFVFVLVLIGFFLLLTNFFYMPKEVASKMISLKILTYSLFTGYPPIVNTLWLYISNLIISPTAFLSNYLNISKINSLNILLPLPGLLFLITCLFKKRFILAILSVTAIIFSPLFILGSIHFIDWGYQLTTVTVWGVTLFLLFILVILTVWYSNMQLAKIGLLGIVIILANLLIPWMISIQPTSNDQSAFYFAHRYYTIPSIGMGMLLASIFSFSVQSIKKLNDFSGQKNLKVSYFLKLLTSGIINLLILATITFIISLQAVTTNRTLVQAGKDVTGKDINVEKIDLFWKEFKSIASNFPRETTQIYIEHDGSLNEKYIRDIFPIRTSIYLGRILNPPQVKFIFSLKELVSITPDNFYAFKFNEENLIDIKKEILYK